MGNLVELARPLLFSFLTNCHTKKLVCDLIDRYVATTDNDIDDVIAKTVRIALLKGC
jgi:DNA-nicking Smr family endonuclease